MPSHYKCHFEPLLRKQRHQCYYCRQMVSRKYPQGHPRKATLDHKVPRARGGDNMRGNLVVACEECNQRKSDLTDREFMGMFRQETGPEPEQAAVS